MEGEDTSPSGAKTQWGEPGDLDTAPVLTIREHLDYLVELINAEWRKTMVYTKYSTCPAEILAPSLNELQDIDIFEDTLIKVKTSTVSQQALGKVVDLREMDRIGNPRMMDLMKLVKDELAKYPFAKIVEGGKDKAHVLAGLLVELAENRMLDEMSSKKAPRTTFQTLVVFMDQFGAIQLKPCLFQHDTDSASFLELVEVYPQGYDLNTKFATSSWDKTVQYLKEKGYGGNPKLGEIEQQIASFKATNYSAVPKWVFYKTNRRISYAKPVEDDGDVKRILEILANPPKDNQLACMVRVCRAVDKDIILINDELLSFWRSLKDNTLQPLCYRFEDAVGIQTNDWFARNLGAEFGFIEADDEAEQ